MRGILPALAACPFSAVPFMISFRQYMDCGKLPQPMRLAASYRVRLPALRVLRLALLASFSYKRNGGHTNTRRGPEGHGGLRGRQGRKYLRSFNEACIFMDSGWRHGSGSGGGCPAQQG